MLVELHFGRFRSQPLYILGGIRQHKRIFCIQISNNAWNGILSEDSTKKTLR